MDLDTLAAFVAFAERNNFSAAAERLHLSQPAVHLRVQKLASDLGRALYRRRVSPALHGLRLYDRALVDVLVMGAAHVRSWIW